MGDVAKPSVADLKSRFENKSPTASSNGMSKVAELKAKLEKSPSSSATVSPVSTPTNNGAAKPAVIRSNSAKTLISTPSPTSGDDAAGAKTVTRSASASKLPTTSASMETPKATLPEPPKISPVATVKSVSAKAEKRPLEEESAPKTEVKPVQPAPKMAPTPATPATVTEEEEVVVVEPTPEKVLAVSIDAAAGVPEPTKAQSPTSLAVARLRFAIDFSVPPSVEEQDYYVLRGLSFVVPFFLLRFVFELVRRFVLYPARMAVRFAPGGNKLLSWLYVKMGPIVLRAGLHLKERLPPMDAVNAAARAGLEKFLVTLQTAGGAAYPHLLHLAESIKTMKFREAAIETIAVLKAWAPMLLLLIPLTKNTIIGARQAWLMFWRVSKTAVYLPFGSLLRGAVQNLGRTLSENPDVFAERVAGLLGPIFGAFVTSIFLVGVGLVLGLVDYNTLSSLYIAWFFRLLGMVSEPSLLDQATLNAATAADLMADATAQAANAAASVADQAMAAGTDAAVGGGGSWVW